VQHATYEQTRSASPINNKTSCRFACDYLQFSNRDIARVVLMTRSYFCVQCMTFSEDISREGTLTGLLKLEHFCGGTKGASIEGCHNVELAPVLQKLPLGQSPTRFSGGTILAQILVRSPRVIVRGVAQHAILSAATLFFFTHIAQHWSKMCESQSTYRPMSTCLPPTCRTKVMAESRNDSIIFLLESLDQIESINRDRTYFMDNSTTDISTLPPCLLPIV